MRPYNSKLRTIAEFLSKSNDFSVTTRYNTAYNLEICEQSYFKAWRSIKMTQEELQMLVEELSLAFFDKPFLHKAIMNNRLRTTGGRYHLHTHALDFNPKILDTFGLDVFKGVIKHELCHYHLHLENKGYRHADADFKNLLKQVEGLRYTPSVEATQESVWRWVYQCKNCEDTIYRKRRFNLKKYICARCKGHFTSQGRKKIKING